MYILGMAKSHLDLVGAKEAKLQLDFINESPYTNPGARWCRKTKVVRPSSILIENLLPISSYLGSLCKIMMDKMEINIK